LVCLFAVSTACEEKIIQIDLPFEGARLVVNGLVYAGEPVRVEISQTTPPADVTFDHHLVPEAKVMIEVAGSNEQHELKYEGRLLQRSIYRTEGGWAPQAGQQLRLSVTAPNLPAVSTAWIQLPEDPVLFTDRSITFDTVQKVLTYSMSFTATQADKFYLTRVLGDYLESPDSLVQLHYTYFPNDQWTPNRLLQEEGNVSSQVSAIIDYDVKDGNYRSRPLERLHSAGLSLESVDSLAGSYLLGLEDRSFSVGGLFSNFTELPTNVVGGYGYWMTATRDTFFVLVE
jgi:hypothetical protein